MSAELAALRVDGARLAARLDALGVEIRVRHRWTGFVGDGTAVEFVNGEGSALTLEPAGGSATPSSYALSVTLGNPGTVTSAPAGIHCGATCSASYAAGTVVTLTATPLPGLAFSGWSGACSAALTPVCTVTMAKALSVKANFSK